MLVVVFWGLEDLFRNEAGVVDTEVGYAGGENDDPTTRNRQGNDVGSSYRSAIFYQDDAELAIATDVIKQVNASGLYNNPVVTSLEPLTTFWTAESYHQDYLRHNPGGYTCHYVRTGTSLLDTRA